MNNVRMVGGKGIMEKLFLNIHFLNKKITNTTFVIAGKKWKLISN